MALTRAVGAASAHILNIETNGLDLVVVSDYVPQSATHMQLSLGMPMEELVGEIVEEFQTTTGQGGDANSPASFSGNTPVYVCGGHPQLNSGLTEALGDILGRQLFLPDPPMDYPEDFLVDQFMVNVGLALKRT